MIKTTCHSQDRSRLKLPMGKNPRVLRSCSLIKVLLEQCCRNIPISAKQNQVSCLPFKWTIDLTINSSDKVNVNGSQRNKQFGKNIWLYVTFHPIPKTIETESTDLGNRYKIRIAQNMFNANCWCVDKFYDKQSQKHSISSCAFYFAQRAILCKRITFFVNYSKVVLMLVDTLFLSLLSTNKHESV